MKKTWLRQGVRGLWHRLVRPALLAREPLTSVGGFEMRMCRQTGPEFAFGVARGHGDFRGSRAGGGQMMQTYPIVFLVDVDNTLVDNDAI